MNPKYNDKISNKSNFDDFESNNRNKFMKVFLIILLFVLVLMFLSIVAALIYSLFVLPKNDQSPNGEVIISIIGIAVTVWIGLNIYNIVSKDDIDKFQYNVTTKIERTYNQFNNKIKYTEGNLNKIDIRLSIIQFISLLNETRSTYIISYYFAICFSNLKEKIENVDLLVEIEYFFIKTTQFYENNNYNKAYIYGQNTIDKINLYNDLTKGTKKNKLIEAYNNCRLSDMYYYKNVSAQRAHKNVNADELIESIELYRKVKEYVFKTYSKSSKARFIENELYGYIHNTIAYTYQELANMLGIEEYNNKADDEYRKVFYYYEERGRYYRNYGTFLERCGHYKEAITNYEKAIYLDKNDYKSYNNLYSLKLKLIEATINKSLKEDNVMLYEFDSSKINLEDIDTIDEAITHLNIISQMSVNFCDIYYNLAKGYMFKYLCNPKKDKTLLDKALNINEFALILDKKNLGALFTKRNIFEAYKKILEANEINNKIREITTRPNDTADKKVKYENYLANTLSRKE